MKWSDASVSSFRRISLLHRNASARTEVWKAEHVDGSRVALKLIAREPDADEQAFRTQRFQAEVDAGQRLHEHVRSILAYGSDPDYTATHPEGVDWIAFEWVEGSSLKEFLDRRGEGVGLNARQIRNVARAIANGLAAMHSAGPPWIHRDVKPENVLLPNNDCRDALLADLGIAWRLGSPRLSRVVGRGGSGTPRYMAPEQLESDDDVTPAADQYALALVLWECATRSVPYAAYDARSDIYQARKAGGPLPALTVDSKPTPALGEVLLRALRPIPAQRWANLTEFLQRFHAAGVRDGLWDIDISFSTVTESARPLLKDAGFDFWSAEQLDFSDSLNEEIWRRSPEVQREIQPPHLLAEPGAVGAQQAMLETSVLSQRGPLPWVPDLVGKKWRDRRSIIVVGSAYAGFIREYSSRTGCMPLDTYLTASSVEEFQKRFLEFVVQDDRDYYMPIANLCSAFGDASSITLMDLCRVSFVRRGLGNAKRADTSTRILQDAPSIFERYVETEAASDWLWRRLAGSRAECILALGFASEHGLLRLIDRHGMRITQNGEPFRVERWENGVWVNQYADPRRSLGYWLKQRTWWTIQGEVDGTQRTWRVLPVYHPASHEKYDAGYRRTKVVLDLMRDAAQ